MMAQDTGMVARTTNPNNDPRLQSTKDIARTAGVLYKRDIGGKPEKRTDNRQRRY